MRKYLVPIANQHASLTAYKLACLKAKMHGGLVQLLHVITSPDSNTPFNVVELMRTEERDAMVAFLEGIKQSIADPMGVATEILIKEGGVQEHILSSVTQETVFIVLCRDHEQGSGELLEWLVSHLDKVLHIPLMVVPAGLTEAQIGALA